MRFLSIIQDIWLELSPWILLGAFVAGLMHVVIPAGWIRRQLSGRMGVLKAVVIGVPLPLCSCGVIPVGLGLRKSGAGSGATVGFLISTPQTGVDSILVSASFLGWPFAILKVAAALVTGLVGGQIAGMEDSEREPSPEPVHTNEGAADTSASDCCTQQPNRFAVFGHALQLIRSIWSWLVAGVIVSAAITYFIPPDFMEHHAVFSGVWALLLTLVISLPLYVCATASVPIAAALVASGFPTGAALVFLMAGPATNVATLGAIYRTLGTRSLVVYLTTIIVGSLLAGVVFNRLIDSSVVAAAAHVHETAWWTIASGILLALIVAYLAWEFAVGFVRRHRTSGSSDSGKAVFVELGTKSE